ncbi:hypothetical protein FVE85_4784 [Porphyridium purpureum]|uniref:Uncharacterized protein n=1 Tax=Porphyridium purpureum TaxID=35688 RepID=A0A5J4YT62_PORPP|nr:hypothetical protein FVE85_4784 [Porphyridium purpureum]|eukprot:POR7365..scf236_6
MLSLRLDRTKQVPRMVCGSIEMQKFYDATERKCIKPRARLPDRHLRDVDTATMQVTRGPGTPPHVETYFSTQSLARTQRRYGSFLALRCLERRHLSKKGQATLHVEARSGISITCSSTSAFCRGQQNPDFLTRRICLHYVYTSIDAPLEGCSMACSSRLSRATVGRRAKRKLRQQCLLQATQGKVEGAEEWQY